MKKSEFKALIREAIREAYGAGNAIAEMGLDTGAEFAVVEPDHNTMFAMGMDAQPGRYRITGFDSVGSNVYVEVQPLFSFKDKRGKTFKSLQFPASQLKSMLNKKYAKIVKKA